MSGKKETEGKESVGNHFRKDELVELVAKVDRIDVVALKIREHDDKEHHGEQEHSGHKDREEEKPAFTTHLVCVQV